MENSEKTLEVAETTMEEVEITTSEAEEMSETNENELEFEYNSGHNFDTSTIDRKIIGTARANAEQLYEFDETIDNHQYKLVFEFNESKDTVTVYEYDNGDEMGYINLFR